LLVGGGVAVYHLNEVKAVAPGKTATDAPVVSPSSIPTPKKRELSEEDRLIVENLLKEYHGSHPENKDNIQLIQTWINEKLIEQGRGFTINLTPRPTTTGIKVKGGKGITIRGNIIDGFDQGIDIEGSEDVKTKENIITGPKESKSGIPNKTPVKSIDPSVTSPPKKIVLSAEQMQYVEKLKQEYVKTFPERSHEMNKKNLQLLENWINDKLKKEGKEFWVHLSPPERTVGTAIYIEGCEDVTIKGGTIK